MHAPNPRVLSSHATSVMWCPNSYRKFNSSQFSCNEGHVMSKVMPLIQEFSVLMKPGLCNVLNHTPNPRVLMQPGSCDVQSHAPNSSVLSSDATSVIWCPKSYPNPKVLSSHATRVMWCPKSIIDVILHKIKTGTESFQWKTKNKILLKGPV